MVPLVIVIMLIINYEIAIRKKILICIDNNEKYYLIKLGPIMPNQSTFDEVFLNN